MLDVKAIAAAKEMKIPDDQIARITPVMQKLDEDLRRVLVNLPDGPDCAFQSRVGENE